METNQTLILVLLIGFATVISAQESGDPEVYADLGSKPYEYHGQGREEAEVDVDEIRIGLFVPTQGRRAGAGANLGRGAELAIDEANNAGGIEGTPLALVVRPDDFVWGSAREVVKLVYEDRVWAVAGAIGGESTHIAEQIITKARVSLLGIATTDASLTQINIPWMFRLMPDDDEIARTLAEYLVDDQVDEETIGGVAILTSTAYDNRLRAQAFEQQALRLGIEIVSSLSFEPGGDINDQLERIARSEAEAIVLWADAEDGVRLLRALAEPLPDARIFAGPGFTSPEVLELEQAEGLIVVEACHLWRSDARTEAFREKYRRRHDAEPDMTAAYAYDGMNLLIAAIRRAGLNRARIRDELANSGVTTGVTGVVHFDGTGSNTARPVMLRIHEQRFQDIP